MNMIQRLAALESQGKPIQVGVVGTGDFGRSMICQLHAIQGVAVPILADIHVEHAVEALEMCGWKRDQIVIAKQKTALAEFWGQGKPIVTADYTWLFDAPIHIIVDCTGDPDAGAKIAYYGLLNGKHVASVNKEADAVIGPLLGRLAKRMGLVYTLVDGDHPCAVNSLYQWAVTLGLKVIAAGKGTRFYREQPQAYSNSQIEMTSTANMTGLIPDVPGMHFRRARLEELPDLLCLEKDGGILKHEGVIEAINCLDSEERVVVDPVLLNSVFIVVTSEYRESLRIMKEKGGVMSKNGDRALLYRPFHLCGIEAPFSILQAALDGCAAGEMLEKPVADVVAVAQRDIMAGEVLDGHGYGKKMVRGIIEKAEVAVPNGHLPLGLACQVAVKEFVPAGTILTYDMLQSKDTTLLWKLRALLEEGM